MKRPRIILVSVLGTLLALGAAAVLVPLDVLRGGLEAGASRALGRQVRIGGSIHLAVFPELGIALKDVSVANVAGTHDPHLIEVGKIVVGAELMPLLAGHLRVTKLVLKQAAIHLEVDRGGIGNWEPAAVGAGPPAATAAGTELSLAHLRIEGGAITYLDSRTGKSEGLSAVSLSLTAPSGDAGGRQAIVDGTATYNSSAVAFNGKVADAAAFLNGEPSDAAINFSSQLANASFTGRLNAPAAATGNLKFDARSLRELAAWAGTPLPPGNGLGALTIDGALAASQGQYALTKATIALDGMKLTGDVSLDTRSQTPALKGALALDHLNVAAYLTPGAGKSSAKAPAALKGVDADLSLTVGPVTLPGVKLDRAALVAALRGGTLTTEFSSIAAYGGSGKGTVIVDAAAAVPAIRATLDMSGVRAERFLGEVMGIAKVSAGGSVRLDVTAHGHSEAELVRSLSGKGSVNFANGSITGVDLGAVARLVQTAEHIVGGAVGGNLKTEFNTLSCSFTAQNGVLRTSDLRLVGSAIQMTGTGTLDLASHQLDFHLAPEANLRVAGIKLADVGIPFFVRGTLDNPSFTPDPAGIPKAVVGTLGGTATRILKVPGGTLKSILNGIR